MQAEPFFHWGDSIPELVEFVASFLVTGAAGFRYSALNGRLGRDTPPGDAGRVFSDAARRAAVIGIIGAAAGLILTAFFLPQMAERSHRTVGEILTHASGPGLGIWLAVLALVGFLLAAGRVRGGWPLAGVAILASTFFPAFSGKWAQLINPMHRFFGGLWIGTLFVLVVAGMAMVLRDDPSREERGAIVADMVNAFSPMALMAGALLVATGLTTAWRHLGSIHALWSTAYGLTLIVKLILVATVFALGAWNWKRQRPTLGTEEAAVSLRRSARAELTVAGVVLLVTSVLVTLPAPAHMHRPPPPPPATAAR